MMLHFGDPSELKTKKIVFEDVYLARDSATLEYLKELSSKRRAHEESINKSSSITEAIAREMSGGLTSHCQQDLCRLEQYTPLLEILVDYVDLVGSNYQMFELCTILFLYAAKLQERAVEILPTDLVQSGTLYREAAGIFYHLAHEVLPSLHPALSAERQPETTSSVSNVLSLICLAEAQEFVSSCGALHELRSQKYLAEGLKISGQVGVAIGVLRDALTM